ncbi:MAG: hypothetical protein QOH86_1352 [Sphingomonadales bacterium]|jgi:hypothetical protein|nr:hypothetical protein [Sphingomonadales bacterium]
MAYLIGALLALGVAVFAALIGLDRDRAFYTTVLIVVASYYDLFAAMAGSRPALVAETLVFAAFLAFAVAGFRWSLWLVAAGLAAHGLFDGLRGGLIDNPGVPPWWPAFCASYDVAAAACLAWLLVRRSRVRASAA